jgi:uncharacterized protein DUF6636
VRVAIEVIVPRAYDLPVRLALAAALVLTLSGSAFGATSFVQFRTPSANIGCGYSSGPGGASLRCDILSGLKPRPAKPRGCDLDWGFGYGLNPTGRAQVVCAGDTAVDKRAKVLRYGQRWSRSGFTCVSRAAGLRCRNRSGHGFFLSRGRSYRF